MNNFWVGFCFAFFFSLSAAADHLRPTPSLHIRVRLSREGRFGDKEQHENYRKEEKERGRMGSSIPECGHACGACYPCKRVMVSFKCSEESCPVVYRCMCRGRNYPVPS